MDFFPNGSVFILNKLDPDFTEEFEVIPKHFFRKANQIELQKIKSILANLGAAPYFSGRSPYENDWKTEALGTDRRTLIELPPEKWRYYVIAFQGNNSEISHLQSASNLIKSHLDYGFILINPENDSQGIGIICPPELQTVFHHHSDPFNFRKPSAITKEDLRLIGEYYKLIKEFPEDFSFVKKAISKFNTLKNIPQSSELLILGYFAIIESLITHIPRGNETLDSINHQIVNKMILLRKRFDRTLNYSEYFKDANEEKIWKMLYSYRSCLAHGNEPNFKKDLQILNNKDTIFSFIQETLKLTIITSLKEPELISDLRNC